MTKKIVLANWKMNKTFIETAEYLDLFNKKMKKLHKQNKEIANKVEYGFILPFTQIPLYFQAFRQNKHLVFGAQDVSEHEKGAYTGDISAKMLNDFNVSYVIVGHSERRNYHNESCDVVYQKAKQALLHNITPIICVGETLEEKQNNQYKQAIQKMVLDSVKDLPIDKIWISYEPYWAIGTGHAASSEYANEICHFIHELLGKDSKVVYGGSVNEQNIAELHLQPAIDGFLVGNASLDVEKFPQIIEKTSF